jgi:uncharacterized protein (UPF0333 family)
MGDPLKYVDQIHSTDAKIISMVTNVGDAISVGSNGSDIVIAQGSEVPSNCSIIVLILGLLILLPLM